jgi:hypothetical protein
MTVVVGISQHLADPQLQLILLVRSVGLEGHATQSRMAAMVKAKL